LRRSLLSRLPFNFPGGKTWQVQVKLSHAPRADLCELEFDFELHLGRIDRMSAHGALFSGSVSSPEALWPIARNGGRVQRGARSPS